VSRNVKISLIISIVTILVLSLVLYTILDIKKQNEPKWQKVKSITINFYDDTKPKTYYSEMVFDTPIEITQQEYETKRSDYRNYIDYGEIFYAWGDYWWTTTLFNNSPSTLKKDDVLLYFRTTIYGNGNSIKTHYETKINITQYILIKDSGNNFDILLENRFDDNLNNKYTYPKELVDIIYF